jgi:hypothetical protein
MNLLSNYLPPSSSPTYASLLSNLPAYKRSLEARYPLMCEKCEPIVEEVIRRGDYRAKTAALNGFLKKSSPRKDLTIGDVSVDDVGGQWGSVDLGSMSKGLERRVASIGGSRKELIVVYLLWHLKRIFWINSLLSFFYLLISSTDSLPRYVYSSLSTR